MVKCLAFKPLRKQVSGSGLKNNTLLIRNTKFESGAINRCYRLCNSREKLNFRDHCGPNLREFSLGRFCFGHYFSLTNLMTIKITHVVENIILMNNINKSKRLFHTQYKPLPLQVPIYTPGWREAIIVKYLAQGHKCHDRDSNPHSGDSTTRT